MSSWEKVTGRDKDYSSATNRLKVLGGWLVRYSHISGSAGLCAMSFVADPHHRWDPDDDSSCDHQPSLVEFDHRAEEAGQNAWFFEGPVSPATGEQPTTPQPCPDSEFGDSGQVQGGSALPSTGDVAKCIQALIQAFIRPFKQHDGSPWDYGYPDIYGHLEVPMICDCGNRDSIRAKYSNFDFTVECSLCDTGWMRRQDKS